MSQERLNKIFDKTDGFCHICHKQLNYNNYGKVGAMGNWEIEHSIARANGGTDHMNNLYAACIPCNRSKGAKNTRTVRAQHGNTRAPYSREKKEAIKDDNTIAGGVLGGLAGIAFGPLGFFVCAGIGAIIGNELSPEK